MQRRQFVKTAGAIVALGAFAGCTEDTNGDSEPDNNGGGGGQSPTGGSDGTDQTEKQDQGPKSKINENDKVKVLSANYEFETFGGPKVSGKVENTTDESLSSVEIQVHYYDSEDTRIGEAMGHVSDLKGGGTATYEAIGLSDVEEGDIARWELTVKVIDI